MFDSAEERYLVEFFGKDYEDYRKRTMTGIPFI
jgi:protein-S-isoprenylcysteine O-methyltransferase Ste14